MRRLAMIRVAFGLFAVMMLAYMAKLFRYPSEVAGEFHHLVKVYSEVPVPKTAESLLGKAAPGESTPYCLYPEPQAVIGLCANLAKVSMSCIEGLCQAKWPGLNVYINQARTIRTARRYLR